MTTVISITIFVCAFVLPSILTLWIKSCTRSKLPKDDIPSPPHKEKQKKKIYVASSWRNNYQQDVVNELRKCGYDVYDFKHPVEGDTGFHWSEIDPNWQNWNTHQYCDALNHSYAQFGFNRDFDAMKSCDACVLCLPCGRSAHLEAGWMKGAGKKVIVYIPPDVKIEPELMYNLLDCITIDITRISMLLEE